MKWTIPLAMAAALLSTTAMAQSTTIDTKCAHSRGAWGCSTVITPEHIPEWKNVQVPAASVETDAEAAERLFEAEARCDTIIYFLPENFERARRVAERCRR